MQWEKKLWIAIELRPFYALAPFDAIGRIIILHSVMDWVLLYNIIDDKDEIVELN